MNDISSIVGASPAIALMLALNAVGGSLKLISQFPNKLIPLALLACGGFGFMFIGNFGHPPPLYPKPLLFIYGVGIAFAAVGLVESKRTLWPDVQPPLEELPSSSPAVPQPQPTVTKP